MIVKKDIIVLIPVYKANPSAFEMAAFKQGIEVLSDYTICLFKPERLDVSTYLTHLPTTEIKSFSNHYFTGIAGYNELMMSSAFYEAFAAYEYMLIYQLDAWVFKDELLEWAAKGYDYIGAPWVGKLPINPKKKIWLDMSRLFRDRVGNGGLSLRRIATHQFICKKMKWAIRFFPKNEDMLWGVVAQWFFTYKVPAATEALKFSVELNPEKAFQDNQQQLPFGCHAWEKYDPVFWSQYIPILKTNA